jgi:hypothetical protein
MACKSCSSGNLRHFQTEIAVHLKDIGSPHVFVFPEILVCLKCGFTELVIAENKLKVLAADGISLPKSSGDTLSAAAAS